MCLTDYGLRTTEVRQSSWQLNFLGKPLEFVWKAFHRGEMSSDGSYIQIEDSGGSTLNRSDVSNSSKSAGQSNADQLLLEKHAEILGVHVDV